MYRKLLATTLLLCLNTGHPGALRTGLVNIQGEESYVLTYPLCGVIEFDYKKLELSIACDDIEGYGPDVPVDSSRINTFGSDIYKNWTVFITHEKSILKKASGCTLYAIESPYTHYEVTAHCIRNRIHESSFED